MFRYAFVRDPASLPPDLRPPILKVVGRYADEKMWETLHERGPKTTSIEEKQNYYRALTQVNDPKLVERTLEIALTDELPRAVRCTSWATSRAIAANPEIAWQFAKTHMKQLLSKADALTVNRYAPGLFTFSPTKAASNN